MTKQLEKKITELQETLDRMTAQKKELNKRFYTNKFKITENMTDDEKKIIQQNIDRRNLLARERYKRNKATREKQQKRARERYHRLKQSSQVTE